jgi:hypothetical protein
MRETEYRETTIMGERVDYYISAVKKKGGHITHVRIHKALLNNSFAPHGILQPRSTVIVNIMSKNLIYKTLLLKENHAQPADTVRLVEVGNRFYLRTNETPGAGDDLGIMPEL